MTHESTSQPSFGYFLQNVTVKCTLRKNSFCHKNKTSFSSILLLGVRSLKLENKKYLQKHETNYKYGNAIPR